MKINLNRLVFKAGVEPLFNKDGRLYFLENSANFISRNSDNVIGRIKLVLKKYPKIFIIIYNLLGSTFVGKNPSKAIKNLSDDKIILNLGSGVKKIKDSVINVDFYPFENVDIIADISDLPFADNSIDAVINEYVLEHVLDPAAVVKEIHRILKPGGQLYLTVPFVASFHSSPDDYYRWTKQGLRQMLGDFEEVECGVRSGPTSALVYVLSEWLGTILSFGLSKLQQAWFMFFMIVLSPLNLIDFLIYKLPSSENIAYGFYFIGKKK